MTQASLANSHKNVRSTLHPQQLLSLSLGLRIFLCKMKRCLHYQNLKCSFKTSSQELQISGGGKDWEFVCVCVCVCLQVLQVILIIREIWGMLHALLEFSQLQFSSSTLHKSQGSRMRGRSFTWSASSLLAGSPLGAEEHTFLCKGWRDFQGVLTRTICYLGLRIH